MKIFLTYFKNEIMVVSLFIVLTVWALSTTVIAIRKQNHNYFVFVKEGNFQVKEELSEADENYLELIFVKRFIQLHYTYNSNNFESNLVNSSNYIKHSLWKEMESRISKDFDYIKGKNISQTAVTGDIKRKDYEYVVTIDVISQKETETLQRRFNVLLELEKVPRTNTNFFGLQVSKLEEKEVLR